MSPAQYEFIKLLRHIIDSKTATQAEIARFLDVFPCYVSRWYRGPGKGGGIPENKAAQELLPKLQELTGPVPNPNHPINTFETMRIEVAPTGEVKRVIGEKTPQFETISDLTGRFVTICKEIEIEEKEIQERTAALHIKKDQANEMALSLKTLRKVYGLPEPGKGGESNRTL